MVHLKSGHLGLTYRELIHSLKNLKWPTLTCESVPWTSHAPLCKLHGWLYVTPARRSTAPLHVGELERGQGLASADADRKHGVSKDDMETTKEDGELPSLVPAVTGANDVKLTPTKGSELEHPGTLSLISKSIISPITKGKSPSSRKQEEDVDLLLESENELDEPVSLEETSDNTSPLGGLAIENLWADCGIQEYTLVLIRKLDNEERKMKLEAKVKPAVAFTIYSCLHCH